MNPGVLSLLGTCARVITLQVFALLFLFPPTVSFARIYVGKLSHFYEGKNEIQYRLEYSPKDFSFQERKSDHVLLITEKKTGRKHKITTSYEGGRGYLPEDYWKEEHLCKTCNRKKETPAIRGARNILGYESSDKEWILFTGPEPKGAEWLFIIEIQKPAAAAEKLIQTFLF